MELKDQCSQLKKKLEEVRNSVGTSEAEYVHFYNWVREQSKARGRNLHKGLSKSNIYKGLQDLLAPFDNGRTEKDVKDLIQYWDSLIEKLRAAVDHYKNQSSGLDINQNEEKFWGTSWYSYYHYALGHYPPQLGRNVIHIRKNRQVEFLNIQDGKCTDYKGMCELINDNVLFFSLRGTTRTDRMLHIKVNVTVSPINTSHDMPLAIGFYNTYEEEHIVSGSLILHQIGEEEQEQGPTPTLLSYYRDREEFEKVPLSIRQYLSVRRLNYARCPIGIFSDSELGFFLEHNQQVNKSDRLFFDPEKPKLFISYTTNDQSKIDIIQGIKKSIDEWAELDNEPIRTRLYPERKTTIPTKNVQVSKIRKELQTTRYFVLLAIDDRSSLAMIELGWAIEFCENVIVFYKEGCLSPLFLSQIKTYNHLTIYRIDDIEKDREIILSALFNDIQEAQRPVRYLESLYKKPQFFNFSIQTLGARFENYENIFKRFSRICFSSMSSSYQMFDYLAKDAIPEKELEHYHKVHEVIFRDIEARIRLNKDMKYTRILALPSSERTWQYETFDEIAPLVLEWCSSTVFCHICKIINEFGHRVRVYVTNRPSRTYQFGICDKKIIFNELYRLNRQGFAVPDYLKIYHLNRNDEEAMVLFNMYNKDFEEYTSGEGMCFQNKAHFVNIFKNLASDYQLKQGSDRANQIMVIDKKIKDFNDIFGESLGSYADQHIARFKTEKGQGG